ncbi:fibroleukin-like [Pseudophryne corroboree]|uniref:fibroleukin-like n=1 Tax=Pseudophryne corroboree TaxID=495146 RepID=UPI00308171BB
MSPVRRSVTMRFWSYRKILWITLLLLLPDLESAVSDNPDCSDRREDQTCLEQLVAMPPPESNCDGTQGCKLHFLHPEEQPPPEELKELHQEPNQEFKQTLKQSGGEGNTKPQNPKSKSVGERLNLLESNLQSVTSVLHTLQDESKVNLSRIEDRLNSLVVLLLGILSGCELPCNESVQKLSALESRRLKTLETKEELPLTVKNVANMGSPVDSSERTERLFPRDCADIYKQGIRDNGIYTIQPIPLRHPFEAYCDMVTDGGGWTVFQRRQDGTVDFNRTWQEYKQGFGSFQGEHWLGNEHLHSLTRLGQHTLRIELEDWYSVKRHANYRKFKVASEQNKYRLTAREYHGNAGNALSYSRNYNHDHKYFTTHDSDNDNYPSGNCGSYYGSGWWFDTCLAANLNGKYYRGRYSGVTSGIYWGTWYILTDKRTNQKYSFKKVEMKTRIMNSQ